MKKIILAAFMLLLSGCSGAYSENLLTDEGLDTNIALYGKDLNDELISEDEDSGMKYVNNQLIITFEHGIGQAYARSVIDSMNGSIVGEIGYINKYQVELENAYSYSELRQKADGLEGLDGVSSVTVNYVVQSPEDSYIPNDSEWAGLWAEGHDDVKNWYIKAIKAQGAWDYKDRMQDINVGVIEAKAFVTNNDEVRFEEGVMNNLANTQNNHGLAVSSVLASKFNDTGICGVMPNAKLYASAVNGFRTRYNNTVLDMFNYETHFAYMICKCRCRVINCSFAWDELEFNASRDMPGAKSTVSDLNTEFTYFFKELLKRDYDFLIVKSAGNQNERYGGYVYKLSDDGKWYERVELEGKIWETEALDVTRQYVRELINNAQIIPNHYEHNYQYDSGNVDAADCIISAIADPDVKSHLIVAGANMQDGNRYKIAPLSSGGTKFYGNTVSGRVDLTAPGEQIWAAAGGNEYKYMNGTSLSTPIVSGIAGMVYGINPSLNAEQVKEIICENTYLNIRMPDAEASVKAALECAPKKYVMKNTLTTRQALFGDDDRQEPEDIKEKKGEMNKLFDFYEEKREDSLTTEKALFGSDSEDKKEKLEEPVNKNLSASNAELKALADELNSKWHIFGWSGYDNETTPFSGLVFKLMYSMGLESVPDDPVHHENYFCRVPADKVDQAAEKIFNAVTDRESLNAEEYSVYYYDGYYYGAFEFGPGEAAFYKWAVNKAEQQADGTYRIWLKGLNYEVTYGENRVTPDIEVTAALKMIDGQRAWTYYTISEPLMN